MSQLLQQLVNGLSIGGIYALVAIGITLIFGLSGIVNFAHGQLLMLGAFAAFAVVDAGLSYFIAVPVAVLIIGVVGLTLERGVFRFTNRSPISGFIVSLGLISVLRVIATQQWGTDPRSVFPPFRAVWVVGSVRIVSQRVFVALMTLLVIAALYYVMNYTHLGRALRAASEDREMSSLLGINTGVLVSLTFVIGSGIAGLGGALLLSFLPVTPSLGDAYIFTGFAVALIGGLGNPMGAAAMGIAVGLAEALTIGYLSSQWADAYVLVVMMVVLLFRPTGLLRGIGGSSVIQ
jgi:branched-chain amino acid transport system permease protein